MNIRTSDEYREISNEKRQLRAWWCLSATFVRISELRVQLDQLWQGKSALTPRVSFFFVLCWLLLLAFVDAVDVPQSHVGAAAVAVYAVTLLLTQILQNGFDSGHSQATSAKAKPQTNSNGRQRCVSGRVFNEILNKNRR